jgi:Apea-like HEPN
LVDAMVALEALLGTETEIAFRLSFRVAGVLGKNPQQREEIFRSTKLFYDIRSRLVHGGTLKPKHRTALRNVDELRGYVRRLLRSFVRLGSSRRPRYDRRFFAEYLDFTLQDDSARHKLQRNLGLAA